MTPMVDLNAETLRAGVGAAVTYASSAPPTASKRRPGRARLSVSIVLVRLGLILGAIFAADLPSMGASAQSIDCSKGCTTTTYGMEGSFVELRVGPGDGSCGPETYPITPGTIVLRERANCNPAKEECLVEVPRDSGMSGQFFESRNQWDFPGVGKVYGSANAFNSYQGNIGVRQLAGRCMKDNRQQCGRDGDCPSKSGCMSTCSANPRRQCQSNSDCGTGDTCKTAIDWNGIGACSASRSVCRSDADCPGAQTCLAGWEYPAGNRQGGANCCDSESKKVCRSYNTSEYPKLDYRPKFFPRPTALTNTPRWIFDGGAGTRFRTERHTVAGQKEGVCKINRKRPCGAKGDFWAGAKNGKCSGKAPCTPSGSASNRALASTCDDVAHGGLKGDVCDYSENGWRTNTVALNLDGSPNPNVCSVSSINVTGTPNRGCVIKKDLPNSDPLPHCALLNFAHEERPDRNCDGIDDAAQGRCHPNGNVACKSNADCPAVGGVQACIKHGDLCPFINENYSFLDTNGDGRGNECQCGDFGLNDKNNGVIGLPDAFNALLCSVRMRSCDTTLTDTDGNGRVTFGDAWRIAGAALGARSTRSLRCQRDMDLSQGRPKRPDSR